MFNLLTERSHAFELAVRWSKSELVFRHRLRRRNKLMLNIRDGAIQHLSDGSMFVLTLAVLGCTNCHQCQHAECKTAKLLPHNDFSILDHYPVFPCVLCVEDYQHRSRLHEPKGPLPASPSTTHIDHEAGQQYYATVPH